VPTACYCVPRLCSAAPVETSATTTEVGKTEVIDHFEALRRVLRKANSVNGLRRGLHETAKVLDNGTARLCLLAGDCENPEYTKLIKALCDASKIHLLEIESRALLGEWCGLVKRDEEGAVRKTVKTSVAAITDFGDDSEELRILMNHLKKESA
jgi:small subunit ribosomal protein S12e